MKGFARWRAAARANGPKTHAVRASADAEAPSPEEREADTAARAFRHWKNAETGRWNPPKYSLRRQAQLVHAAFLTGDLEQLPESPKKDRLLARLREHEHHEVFEGVPRPMGLGRLPSYRDTQEALRIAHKSRESGPYAGRSNRNMFKGARADREARARRVLVDENMSRMDEIVQEWRRVRLAAAPSRC